MKNIQNRGFTLIELLVVIAIIGILSAVVLASLSTARSKGNDASVEESMHNLRNAAEIYYSSQNPGSYGTVITNLCTTGMFTDPTGNMASLIAAINKATKVSTDYDEMSCSTGPTGASAATAWAVSTLLPSGSSAFCVDSSGWSNTKNRAGVTYSTNVFGSGTNDPKSSGTGAAGLVCR